MQLRPAGTNDEAVRPDGRLFACAGWDGRARLYTLRKRQEPRAVLKDYADQVTALALSPGRQVLATPSRDTTIALWDVYSSSSGSDGGDGGGGSGRGDGEAGG